MGNLIVGAVLLVIVGLAVFSLVRERRRGGCAGCPGGCHCESCAEEPTKPVKL